MSLSEAGATAVAAGNTACRPVRFLGTGKQFWAILFRGAVLLMVTLGIYRFWLATDVRRFLWGNTTIDGESLEYSGTAIELLQGFLVAIALILPIYTIFLITILDLGTVGSALSAAAVILLAFLSQYGIYLARRYRLTRTVFRGLRFHQTGSAIRYAICAIWWWSLTAFTLGFVYPFTRAALERLKMRHTYFGDLQGRFEASGWSLFWRGFLMWLAVLIPALMTLTTLLSVNWPAAMAAMRGGGDVLARIERASPGFASAIAGAIVLAVVCLVLIAALFPAFHALVVRWWISGLRFGEVTAISHLRTRDVYWTYLRFVGGLLVFALLLIVGIFVGLLIIGIAFQSADPQVSEIVTVLMLVGTYVVAALGLITLYQSIVMLSVWRLAAESIELVNAGALARVRAAGDASSPLGEGIADVLNLGGI